MALIPNAGLDAANNAVMTQGPSSYNPSTTYWLSLHYGTGCGTTGSNEDFAAGRQAITFAGSTGAQMTSTETATWANPPGGTGYYDVGVWTGQTGGTFLRGAPISGAPVSPTSQQELSFQSGNVQFTAS